MEILALLVESNGQLLSRDEIVEKIWGKDVFLDTEHGINTAPNVATFLKILEETRSKYRFVIHGYVVMPEHFHLLITEPEVGDPSVVMKVVKQRFARRLNQLRKRSSNAQTVLWDSAPDPIWQKRFYDFNVWTERIEKLRYMNRNPVKRGL